jgi:hypothetical protein
MLLHLHTVQYGEAVTERGPMEREDVKGQQSALGATSLLNHSIKYEILGNPDGSHFACKYYKSYMYRSYTVTYGSVQYLLYHEHRMMVVILQYSGNVYSTYCTGISVLTEYSM